MRRDFPVRRRALLRTVALGATPLALAGCLGTDDSGSGGTGTPDVTGTPSATPTPIRDVETYAWNGAPDMERRDAAYPQGSVGPHFVAALRSNDEATTFRDAYLSDGASTELTRAVTFLGETDYERQSVIVLQDQRGSSHPNLELVQVVPAPDSGAAGGDGTGGNGGSDSTGDGGSDSTGVHVHARYPGEGRTADVIEDNLLVRVPGAPAFVRATLTPQYGDPVTFATENALGAPILDDPRKLVVRNLDCADHVVSIRGSVDGTLVTRESVEAPAGSIRVVDDVFRHAAIHAVEASLTSPETATSASVAIGADDPRHVSVGVDGSAGISISRVDGTPAERRIQCEPEQRPYESSDPAQNVADPVDLWVVSQDPDPRTLTVTIRDGDARVFQRTFEMAGGNDKAREADLLAKKGTCTLTVEPASGDSVERTVEVREGVGTLSVHVSEDGGLEIVSN